MSVYVISKLDPNNQMKGYTSSTEVLADPDFSPQHFVVYNDEVGNYFWINIKSQKIWKADICYLADVGSAWKRSTKITDPEKKKQLLSIFSRAL